MGDTIVPFSAILVNFSLVVSPMSSEGGNGVMLNFDKCRLAYPRPGPNHKIQDWKPYNFASNLTIFRSNHTILIQSAGLGKTLFLETQNMVWSIPLCYP